MVNVLSSEHNQRNQAFEYLVYEQFETIPGGREALLGQIGQKAVELMPIIDNYFLPDIKNSEIIKPKHFNLTASEKTPVVPVLNSDSKLRIKQGEVDVVRPTPQQYKNGKTPEYIFPFPALNELSDEIDDSIDSAHKKLLSKKAGGVVCSLLLSSGDFSSFTRPILMMPAPKTKCLSDEKRIETLGFFMHESMHVKQMLEIDPFSDFDAKKEDLEQEAYDMSKETIFAVKNLLRTNQKKSYIKKFGGWF